LVFGYSSAYTWRRWSIVIDEYSWVIRLLIKIFYFCKPNLL
jgi:hypothetical protein